MAVYILESNMLYYSSMGFGIAYFGSEKERKEGRRGGMGGEKEEAFKGQKSNTTGKKDF